ncbi:hypothetical protein [Niastella vici]|uniref:hypothetical protein n=1 Tax=Niastella vici TaxID=1703345 RepID=UPI001301BB1A|nr:hypothetical protein [Niastella vici]
MMETIGHLKKAGMKPPICIEIAGDRMYSITHLSNAIKVDELLAEEICKNCFVVN